MCAEIVSFYWANRRGWGILVWLIGGWLGLDFTMDGVWIWALRRMMVRLGLYERFGIFPAPWRGGCSGSFV